MTARKHHFVPQCYLKGFTKHRNKPKLFVIDAKERRYFRTTTANVAAERDFHTIQLDGKPSDALENAFAGFESELSQALERIIAARSIQDENDRTLLLNLIGLQAVKNPRFRETMRSAYQTTASMMVDMITSSPERWAASVARAKAEGFIEEAAELDYETAKRPFDEGYVVEVPPARHLHTELEIFDKLLPLFFDRKWTLFKAPQKVTGFITSDHPMCLMWSDPAQRGRFYGPGLGLRNTMIIFPVSNELALIGAFEGEDQEVDADKWQVAAINGAIVTYAERQVFARDSDFFYSTQPGEKPRDGVSLLNDANFSRPRNTKVRPGQKR